MKNVLFSFVSVYFVHMNSCRLFLFQVVVHHTVQYSPVNETSGRINYCSRLVHPLLTDKSINPDLDYLYSVEAVSMNCSALTGQPEMRLSNNYTCPSHQKLRQLGDTWWCCK